MAAVTCLILTAAFLAYALRLITRTPSRTPPRMTGWKDPQAVEVTGCPEDGKGCMTLWEQGEYERIEGLYDLGALDPRDKKAPKGKQG